MPARLPVRAVLALLLLVQRRPPIASHIECEQRNPAPGVLDMRMLVPTDVFGETMHKEDDSSWEGGWVRPRVELRPSDTRKPGLNVVFPCDRWHDRRLGGGAADTTRR